MSYDSRYDSSNDRPTLNTTKTRTQVAMGATSRRPRREHAELVLAFVLFALAAYVAYFTATMTVIGDSEPGPQFFPTIIAVVLFATSLGIAVRTVRNARTDQVDVADAGVSTSTSPASDDAAPEETTTPRTDWRTLGIVVGTFIAFILVLEPLGWLISAAGLYWGVCVTLGAKNPLRVLAVAFIFSALVQIAFAMGLGLALPTGIIGGLF
jgi:putative tricarboxylic transport membrane protein